MANEPVPTEKRDIAPLQREMNLVLYGTPDAPIIRAPEAPQARMVDPPPVRRPMWPWYLLQIATAACVIASELAFDWVPNGNPYVLTFCCIIAAAFVSLVASLAIDGGARLRRFLAG